MNCSLRTRAADAHSARAIVLGHPLARRGRLFGRIVDAVARRASCPVVVVRFVGPLHTERILVPVSTPEEFAAVHPLICALGQIEEHYIIMLRLMPPQTPPPELESSLEDLAGWPICQQVPGTVTYRAIAAESRVHDILEEAREHDIIVMATATAARGLRRVFFGSLAEDVAQRSQIPILLVSGQS